MNINLDSTDPTTTLVWIKMGKEITTAPFEIDQMHSGNWMVKPIGTWACNFMNQHIHVNHYLGRAYEEAVGKLMAALLIDNAWETHVANMEAKEQATS